MEDFTDADYAHGKRVCKDLEIKNLGDYQDLYVQNNTLLLADIFENFIDMCNSKSSRSKWGFYW